MEEIRINEYVRTDNGQIFKVLEVEKGSVKIKSDYREWIGICCILKHSFNIIDLIEEGDYVNGNKINCFKIFNNISGEQCLNINYIYTNSLIIPVKDIKSIVTKEQFESIKYEVIK